MYRLYPNIVGAAVHLRPCPPITPLARTLFSRLAEEQKSTQRGGVPVRQKRRRGSLERLSTAGLPHAHGAQTCPLSAITRPFSPPTDANVVGAAIPLE